MKRLAHLLLLVTAVVVAACSDAERSQPGPEPPATIRSVPYDVGDTSQAGQLSIFNSRPGGGSVGMPVRFGDVDGDGWGDFVACPMLADSGPAGDRRESGEVHVYFGTGETSGVVVNAPESDSITTLMGARPGDLLGNETDVADLDRDGFADLIIGAQNYDGLAGDRRNAGGVFLYFGRPARPRIVDLADARDGVVRISGGAAGDRLGIWVTAGDVDGDGALDLLLGADQADGPDGERPDSGAIYVIFGGQELPAEVDLADPGALRVAVIHGSIPVITAARRFAAPISTATVTTRSSRLAGWRVVRARSRGRSLRAVTAPTTSAATRARCTFSSAPIPSRRRSIWPLRRGRIA